MNTIILNGRTCQDMEVIQAGKNCYVRFNLAVDDGKDADGIRKTMFVPCIAWNKTATILEEYVRKGDRLILEGKLNIQKYADKEDEKTRTSVQVVVNRFDFIETRSDSDEEEEEPERRPAKTNSPKRKR